MDPIDRDAAIKELRALEDSTEIIPFTKAKEYAILILQDAQKRLLKLPSVQPECKTGHWERHNTYHGDDTSGSVDPDWRCSECGRQANVNAWCMYDLTDFCPNCGADMRGEQNGSD